MDGSSSDLREARDVLDRKDQICVGKVKSVCLEIKISLCLEGCVVDYLRSSSV